MDIYQNMIKIVFILKAPGVGTKLRVVKKLALLTEAPFRY